jgi:hypothetical protein
MFNAVVFCDIFNDVITCISVNMTTNGMMMNG